MTESRRLSRNLDVIARDAAARIDGAACDGKHQLWGRQEAAHAAATTQTDARAAAAPLLRLCATCPLHAVAACADWARKDQYTGIAAGSAWQVGKPQPAHWVNGHPPTKELRKAG